MELAPFEHLLYYEKVHGARLNISYSNIRDFRLDGFRRHLPKDLDLNWTFRNGTPELRRLIARRHRTSPNRVLVTTGATEANFLVNASLVHPRDRVLVDSPIYSPLRDVPRGLGANVVEIARDCEDGWRLDLDRWRKAAGRRARLLVFANLNNPTSTALSRANLRELADIAEECDGRVLVDETFRELSFNDTPPSAAGFGPRMIALSTVTKLCGLGTLRVGWIVGAPDPVKRFARLKDYTTGGGSVLSQTIATWALGRWELFIRRAKRILAVNRKIAVEALRGMPALRGDVPSAGTVMFPHSTVNVPKLASRLVKQYGTVIAEGRFFGVPDHFRLGLGGDPRDLRKGLANLRRLLRSMS
jgi:aspartate/methionine/tyrosine aminotransferase